MRRTRERWPPRRQRRRCDDNIKLVLRETDCKDRNVMELAQHNVQWRGLDLAVLILSGFPATVLIN
jgi:hypothetical protein